MGKQRQSTEDQLAQSHPGIHKVKSRFTPKQYDLQATDLRTSEPPVSPLWPPRLYFQSFWLLHPLQSLFLVIQKHLKNYSSVVLELDKPWRKYVFMQFWNQLLTNGSANLSQHMECHLRIQEATAQPNLKKSFSKILSPYRTDTRSCWGKKKIQPFSLSSTSLIDWFGSGW